jgi:acetyl esterase
MWGTTSYEFFSSEETITVTKDMMIGATFVNRSLVSNLNIYRDIVYAKPGKKELKYDVFAPKGGKDLPMVVIIHGGGWSSNNEDIMRAFAWELAKENTYVVASIDYRWINSLDGDETPNSMHHLVEDVFGAIAHLQENASKYGANPNQIAVTGDSAGGHLSAAATLSDQIGIGDYPTDFKLVPTYLKIKPQNKWEKKSETLSKQRHPAMVFLM